MFSHILSDLRDVLRFVISISILDTGIVYFMFFQLDVSIWLFSSSKLLTYGLYYFDINCFYFLTYANHSSFSYQSRQHFSCIKMHSVRAYSLTRTIGFFLVIFFQFILRSESWKLLLLFSYCEKCLKSWKILLRINFKISYLLFLKNIWFSFHQCLYWFARVAKTK